MATWNGEHRTLDISEVFFGEEPAPGPALSDLPAPAPRWVPALMQDWVARASGRTGELVARSVHLSSGQCVAFHYDRAAQRHPLLSGSLAVPSGTPTPVDLPMPVVRHLMDGPSAGWFVSPQWNLPEVPTDARWVAEGARGPAAVVVQEWLVAEPDWGGMLGGITVYPSVAAWQLRRSAGASLSPPPPRPVMHPAEEVRVEVVPARLAREVAQQKCGLWHQGTFAQWCQLA